MHTKNIQRAGGILIKDRKFMLERHGGKLTCLVPGGKLEPGETPEQALVREFEEEFHLEISIADLELLGTFTAQAVHSPESQVTLHTFLIQKWVDNLVLDDGIESVVWINSKNVKDYELGQIALKNVLPLLVEKNLID